MLCELDYYDSATFLTLTYNEENVSSGLIKDDLKRFIKGLRNDGLKFKYYACGEYGEKCKGLSNSYGVYFPFGRPHFHLILFGVDSVKDLKTIQDNWSYGFIYCGSVTYDSCRYVADYVQKKYSKDYSKDVYGDFQPPFSLMSKGIGKRYALDNKDELLKNGFMRCNKGSKVGLPRYFYKLYGVDVANMFIDKKIDRYTKCLDKWSAKLGENYSVNWSARLGFYSDGIGDKLRLTALENDEKFKLHRDSIYLEYKKNLL